jgi:3-oxoacyl-[acyl-carrier-protein] synthase-3
MMPTLLVPSAVSHTAVLCGLGAALPETVVSNADLCARLDTTDEWIRARTGITHRRIADPGTSTEDLAVQAAAEALACCGRQGVQALLLATTTPDLQCPATAPAVASRLGLGGILAMDLAAGCTGFLYGLATAVGLIASAMVQEVLVIGAERLTRLPKADDRSTVPLFGDGAGAVVLRRGMPGQAGAIGPLVLGSDGEHSDLITAPREETLQMQGLEVFRHAVNRMSAASQQAARVVGWQMQDVDYLVPHQANARITGFVAQQLGIPDDRQLSNIQEVGNTGAASIPVVLAHAAADGRLKAGHRVLLTAFGSGLTWGATTLIWPDLHI